MYNGLNGPKRKDDHILQRNLEEENKKNFELLHQNINELQTIGIEIKDFITNENKSLNTLGNTYDNSKSLLDFTMKRIDILMSSSYGRITFYLLLMVFFVLIILYFLKP